MIAYSTLVAVVGALILWFALGAVVVLILGCAMYLCITSFRKLVRRTYRKLKLLYWPEKSFRFLDLPPEIRLITYAYTLPEDRIYYMTARKMRVYSRLQKELIVDEVVLPLPALLRVCRLIHQELRPIVYKNNSFYITIYSIRDLLYAIELLNNSANSSPFYFMNRSHMMKHIRIRVKGLIIDLYPVRLDGLTLVKFGIEETSPIWFGPGKWICRDRSDVTRMLRAYLRVARFWISVRDVRGLLNCVLLDGALDATLLNKLLPWYQRRRKPSISPV